jgi:hypothetical protein
MKSELAGLTLTQEISLKEPEGYEKSHSGILGRGAPEVMQAWREVQVEKYKMA